MKKGFITVYINVCLLLIVSGCNQEVPDVKFAPYSGSPSDTAWARNADGTAQLFSQNVVDTQLSIPALVRTINPLQAESVTLLSGVLGLPVTPFSLPVNGTAPSVPVTAPVELIIKSAFTNGDLVRQGFSTSLPDRPLRSGGILNVRARINNVDLVLRSGSEMVFSRPVNSSATAYISMGIYSLQAGAGTNMWNSWTLVKDSSRIDTAANGAEWKMHIRRMGVLAAFDTAATISGKTLHVILPLVFTNINTVVYTAATQKLSVQRFTPISAQKAFILSGGEVQNGDRIFSLSFRGDQWYLASLIYSTNSNPIIRFEPQPVSLAQVQSFLDGL